MIWSSVGEPSRWLAHCSGAACTMLWFLTVIASTALLLLQSNKAQAFTVQPAALRIPHRHGRTCRSKDWCTTIRSRHSRLDMKNDKSSHFPTSETTIDSQRRSLLDALWATSTLPLGMLPQAGYAETAPPSGMFDFGSSAASSNLPVGLLESRVLENLLSPPTYGMEGSDILYPSWFKGTWNVASKTASIQAPCGLALFGSNATYAAALDEVGTTLSYQCRFIPAASTSATPTTSVIADREFNVQSIAKASMGVNSVVDIPLASPNRFTAILAPKGAPSLLQVDLLIVRRRQETRDETHFDCSEVVREIVSPVGRNAQSSGSPPPVWKEIETTSLYTYSPNQVTCRQRSASFLLPVPTDPMRMRMWEYARGRPVNIRMYDVVYARV